ncbi:MAG TPA: acetyl-CoA hydrolase/transferase C-terminal domain-containing protein [Solirubrobacterales bacterium]
MATPERLSAADAVATLGPDQHVVLPPGCSEALAIEAELGAQRDRLAGMRISSGLLLGDYEFLAGDAYRYSTWHVMPPVRKGVESGAVEFFPIRGSQVIPLLSAGPMKADVAVIHVSPPDAHGYCSLGTSASYPLSLARRADRVIAQVNPRMPRTLSTSYLNASDFDVIVEVDEPLLSYGSPPVDEVSRRIGEAVAELIPDGATLQIGIGAIPEAVLETLAAAGRRGLTLWGMGVDTAVDLIEAGVLGGGGRPAVITAEMMATPKLFDFADSNPEVLLEPFEVVLDPARMNADGPFISINSAVEIDLTGQVNAEYVAGRQISGVGGGFDFLTGGLTSAGGRSVIAMSADTAGGKISRIVPRLQEGAPVGVPRHHLQTVVTEHGLVHLDGLSLSQRAQALIGIAAPRFREELQASLRGAEEEVTANA